MEKDSVDESQSKTIIDSLNLTAIIIGDKSVNKRNEILNTESLENFQTGGFNYPEALVSSRMSSPLASAATSVRMRTLWCFDVSHLMMR